MSAFNTNSTEKTYTIVTRYYDTNSDDVELTDIAYLDFYSYDEAEFYRNTVNEQIGVYANYER